MSIDEIIEMVDRGNLQEEYAEYIMDNCGGDRIICNGNLLTIAQEDGYLLEEFAKDYQARS